MDTRIKHSLIGKVQRAAHFDLGCKEHVRELNDYYESILNAIEIFAAETLPATQPTSENKHNLNYFC